MRAGAAAPPPHADQACRAAALARRVCARRGRARGRARTTYARTRASEHARAARWRTRLLGGVQLASWVLFPQEVRSSVGANRHDVCTCHSRPLVASGPPGGWSVICVPARCCRCGRCGPVPALVWGCTAVQTDRERSAWSGKCFRGSLLLAVLGVGSGKLCVRNRVQPFAPHPAYA